MFSDADTILSIRMIVFVKEFEDKWTENWTPLYKQEKKRHKSGYDRFKSMIIIILQCFHAAKRLVEIVSFKSTQS